MNKVTQLAISDSATVHLVLQGKGGVGKSFVAAILAQYLQSKSMPVQCLDIDGKPFEEFEVATQHAAKLLGTVLIPERDSDTYGEDLRRMLGQRLTFDEAIQSADFTLLAKQRLVIVRRELFEQLDRVAIT